MQSLSEEKYNCFVSLLACLEQHCGTPSEFMQECGILDESGSAHEDSEASGGVNAGRRVLVFAQLRGLLDLVEEDLLRPANIPFLRLDGGCNPQEQLCPSQSPSPPIIPLHPPKGH